MKNPGKVRARTYGTKSPSRSERTSSPDFSRVLHDIWLLDISICLDTLLNLKCCWHFFYFWRSTLSWWPHAWLFYHPVTLLSHPILYPMFAARHWLPGTCNNFGWTVFLQHWAYEHRFPRRRKVNLILTPYPRVIERESSPKSSVCDAIRFLFALTVNIWQLH